MRGLGLAVSLPNGGSILAIQAPKRIAALPQTLKVSAVAETFERLRVLDKGCGKPTYKILELRRP